MLNFSCAGWKFPLFLSYQQLEIINRWLHTNWNIHHITTLSGSSSVLRILISDLNAFITDVLFWIARGWWTLWSGAAWSPCMTRWQWTVSFHTFTTQAADRWVWHTLTSSILFGSMLSTHTNTHTQKKLILLLAQKSPFVAYKPFSNVDLLSLTSRGCVHCQCLRRP